MDDLAALIGWVVLIVAIAMFEAWLYIQCYQAGGYWGVFWGIIGMAFGSAIVKWVVKGGD